MISLYSGTPGSGKSLHLADIIFNRCRHQVLTIGNFEINRDIVENSEYYEYVDNQDLSPYYLYDRSNFYFEEEGNRFKEGAILLIIDEAQLIFNVREWNMKGREDWIRFFTQHRKLGFDIIIVAQFDKMIDKQVRALFEYEFIHRKMSNFGWKGKMISIWFGHRLFVCVQMWYPMKERIGAFRFLYRKKLGELYNTRLIFEKPEGYVEYKKQKDFLPFNNSVKELFEEDDKEELEVIDYEL